MPNAGSSDRSPAQPPPDASRVCPVCGVDYGSEVLFCPRDGATLQQKTARADLVGRIIAERYHVLRPLGEGGMGKVYLAEQLAMGRMCAIKIMHAALRSDAEAVGRFRREAANSGRITHPNVAAIYDCGETSDGLIYLAMEYVPGESLGALIKWEGAFAPRRAVGIAVQIARALEAAHQTGIIHRDLKPDNIIVARSRDGDDLVKVVDFGIAKATRGESQTLTRTGFVIGTLQYMSPEQMVGDRIDARSDLYSLGCILYEMLTGERVFGGVTGEAAITKRLVEPPPRPGKVSPQVPPALDGLVVRLLARAPGDRFQGAGELAEALVRLSLEPRVPLGRRLITPWRGIRAEAVEDSAPPGSEATTGEGPDRSPPPPPGARSSSSRKRWSAIGGLVAAASAGAIFFAARAEPPAADSRVPVLPTVAALLPPSTGVADSSTMEPPVAPPDGTAEHPPPLLSGLAPSRTTAGATGSRVMTVRGRDFHPSSVVQWNGSERPTVYASPTELRAELTPQDVASARTARVTVMTRPPGGGVSRPLAFEVLAPPRPVTDDTTTAAGPASRAEPPPVSAPPAAAVGELRGQLAQARAFAAEGFYEDSFRVLRSAAEALASLRSQHPQAVVVDELAREHSDRLVMTRRACEALAAARREVGAQPPVCSYP
jgi:eukaryotic-like serine/threonine-protein kinase